MTATTQMNVTTSPGLYLTDSGIETVLIHLRGIDLPQFAAFPLLDDPAGRLVLADYYREHLAIADDHQFGFVFEAPTWRASTDWGRAVGYDQPALDRINEQSIAFLSDLAADAAGPTAISGCVGPRADGYNPATLVSADEAADYHRPQIAAFERAGADLANAMTMSYPDEAIGVVLAAASVRLPVAISFTLETDGQLPDGTALADAIAIVDAATDAYAAYFGVNCAHPSHIEPALRYPGEWTSRLRALRANASRRSHAELDDATELDEGDPIDLAHGYAELRRHLPGFTIVGGCCGTDARHLAAIADVL